MSTITLLIKANNSRQLEFIGKNLESTFKGLKVNTEVHKIASNKWVQVTVSGEDEAVAQHYLADEIGLCPVAIDNVKTLSVVKGFATSLNKNKDALSVDIGVFSPNTIYASIPLSQLQAQLVDGRKMALKKIVELFGICENLPLETRILKVDKEEKCIGASLSEKQVAQYREWVDSLLDRLIVLGASFNGVKLAVEMADLNRDVVNIEPLGMFEHVVTCKLGTDAAGLIPKIGKNLRNASFIIFNPRKIKEILEQ